MAKFTAVKGNPFDPQTSEDNASLSIATTPVEGNPFTNTGVVSQEPVDRVQFGEPQPTTSGVFAAGGTILPRQQSDAVKDIIKIRTGVDKEKGIDNFAFRTNFSRADNPSERAKVLNDNVGNGNWRIDLSGDYIVDPIGLSKLGIQSDLSRPIDESGFTTGDIADFVGDAPAIIGAVGGSVAASGLGLPAGIAMTAAGAALGKGIDEALEYFQGKNLQSGADVLTDIGIEGLKAGAGEGLFRAGSAIGRKLLKPSSKDIPAEELALVKEAQDIGVHLKPSQINDNKLLARLSGLIDNVLGSTTAKQNQNALDKAVVNLGVPNVSKKDAGEAIVGRILDARQALREWSKTAFDEVDNLTGGQPFIPTRKFKEAVQLEIDKTIDQTTGEIIPAFQKDFNQLTKLASLPEFATVAQMQTISNGIDMASDTVTRTIADSVAASLSKGVQLSYDDMANFGGNEVGKGLLKEVRTKYAQEIAKFDDAVIKAITKDPKVSLTMEPSKVVKAIFRPDSPKLVSRVMNFADESTKLKIQGAAMKQFITSFRPESKDLTDILFNGLAMKKMIDKFGKDTMNEMFGERTVKQLNRLADIARISSRGTDGAGSLAAVAIALRPIGNIATILRLNLLGKLMRTEKAMKWLTIGFAAPRTRVGAAALSRLGTFTAFLARSEQASFSERIQAIDNQGAQ